MKGRDGIEVVARGTFVWTIRDGAIERVPCTRSGRKPSKPWACRSRRCPRRTWRSCGAFRGLQPCGILPRFSNCLIPTWSGSRSGCAGRPCLPRTRGRSAVGSRTSPGIGSTSRLTTRSCAISATESSVFGHWRARGRASGVEVENQPGTWLYEIKDGKSRADADFHGPSRSPRNPGPLGVGDVAGERGDEARGPHSLRPLSERASQRRSLDERLFVRSPPPTHFSLAPGCGCRRDLGFGG